MTIGERFYTRLTAEAKRIESDVREQWPEAGDFEVATRSSYGDFFGLIYAGELGHWWFIPDDANPNGLESFTPDADVLRMFAPAYELES